MPFLREPDIASDPPVYEKVRPTLILNVMGDRVDKARKSDLRKKAEARLKGQIDSPIPNLDEDKQYLISELGTYRMELEIQNEDLRVTQRELERSSDMLARLYDFAPVGYFTIDEKGVIRSVNFSGAEILGQARSNVVGKLFSQFVRVNSFVRFRKHLEEVFHQKATQFCEIEIIGKDNSFITVELRSTPIADSSGKEMICQTAVIDISDRKQASEYKKWADIFDNTQIGLYVRGDSPFIEMMNPAFARMHGYTVAELIGNPLKDLYIPEEQARLSEYFGIADEKGSFIHESAHVRKDGSSFPVEIAVNVVRDKEGKILYRIVNVQDISERKKAEEALRQSEKRFRAFFEAAGVGTAILDLRTKKYAEVNQHFCDITGYSCEELRNLTFEEITHPDDIPGDIRKYKAVMSGKSAEYTTEKRYIRKDGGIIWVHISAAVIPDLQGRPLQAAGIILDISKRREAEAEVERLNRSLQLKVADLESAQKEIQTAYKELESFSYSVSHDLRAPLRQMTSFAGLLQKTLKDHRETEAQKHIDAIFAAGGRMTDLIDDILSFSHLGRKELVMERVELGSLVSAVVGEFREETPRRDIEWKIGSLPVVYGDEAMLRQVLVNLISNAMKFTATRAKAVIEIGHSENEKEFIFSVRDNGVGFDMKHAGRLFGVFQRLHTQSEFEGTGIGLANVHRIISRHGGKIWAEGVENGGATFFFSLPKKLEPLSSAEKSRM